MDQNDIDAMMNTGPDPEDDSGSGGGDGAQPDPQASAQGGNPPIPPGDDAASGIDQADLDALLGDSSVDASPASGSQADPGAVDQSDIDSLMAEAQSLASEPTVGAEAASPMPEEPVLDSTGKPMDEMATEMAAAIAEEKAAKAASAPQPTQNKKEELPVEQIELPEFDVSELVKAANQPLSLLYDVDMHVRIELGRTNMFVEDVLKLGTGSVVELDRLAGDPVDVYVNGRMVARGEVLVLNDNFCVRISEVVADPKESMVG